MSQGLSPLAELGIDAWTDELKAQVLERAANDFDRWEAQVRGANHCYHPVRLQGRVRQMDVASGEVREVYSTAAEPDQMLLVACGNRRECVCPSCSRLYKGDARHIALSGLIGGKGVPETVRRHPRLFVTFTAPSFGAVHASIAQGKNLKPCHPRRGGHRCPHGRPLSCTRLHRPDDPMVGEALCAECFDYEGLVVWNALAPELWRRTVQDMRRGIAKARGLSQKACDELAWLQYFKVAEYQARGAVHFHAMIRLDAAAGRHEPASLAPPPQGFDAALLEAVVRSAVANARAPDPRGGQVGWGTQLDVRRLKGEARSEDLSEEAVAFYVAKYAAKGAESLGAALARPIRTVEAIAALDVRPQVKALVQAAWHHGARPELEGLRLRNWCHAVGFGGHFATKSRTYSTTFKRLRGVRKEKVRRQRFKDEIPLDAWDRPEEEGAVIVLAEWGFKGTGYRSTGERILALGSAARAREGREAIREQRARATA